MKILILGKFPPIQGGVSAQTFWMARQLADLGHQVSVVTNAREVEDSYRIFMRPEDWEFCEGVDQPNLRVYWTDFFDLTQRHIPSHNPFTTKLVSLGLEAARERGADVVFSFYLEPYAVAGHCIAQELGLPHIVKTAGSDVGRLYAHPQYRPFYRQIFKHAKVIWTGGRSLKTLIDDCNLSTEALYTGGYPPPDNLFQPDGEALNLEALMDELTLHAPDLAKRVFGRPRENLRYFGMYGKIASNKGTFDLIEALGKIPTSHHDTGLLLMGSVSPPDALKLHQLLRELRLEDRVLHIPFLPHWRVPQFIRRCFAVCCLERDFPIPLHKPVIAREVMLTGGCLIGSTEILRKMPSSELLIDGYNCVAIDDVHDTERLSRVILRMSQDADRATTVRQKAVEYTDKIRDKSKGARHLEQLLCGVIEKPAVRSAVQASASPSWAACLNAVRSAISEPHSHQPGSALLSAGEARRWAEEMLEQIGNGDQEGGVLGSYRPLVQVCLLLSKFDGKKSSKLPDGTTNYFFRLERAEWALADKELLQEGNDLTWNPIGNLSIEELSVDANQLLQAVQTAVLPASFEKRKSFILIQRLSGSIQPRVFVIDLQSAQLLSKQKRFKNDEEHAGIALSGRERATAIALFQCGVISLKYGAQRREKEEFVQRVSV